ncbi:MAG TPA: ATP-dependent DNA ligase [Verrucomicrobiales bacterium]|jgi:DNA ligase-1|nr:ATP-dependent DNA ligase [Verrucomicrobiales bacterium]
MKRFTRLYTELDQTNRTGEKTAALESYFREAPPADAAWALHFLCGRRPPRSVNSTVLREWAAEEAGVPSWLMDECYEAVGDLAETISLILPDNTGGEPPPLHQLIEQRLLPLKSATDSARREVLLETWRELDAPGRLVWNKLITGSFRVGVAQTLVVRALAAVAGIDQAVMAHRVLGEWQPTPNDYLRLLHDSPDATDQPAKPYPFYLASPLEDPPESLGPVTDWQAEWKWDGIRAQLIRRGGMAVLWSRGDEMVTDTFPEIRDAARSVPSGTVLDGELLAWSGEAPLPFSALQRRLGRKVVSARLKEEIAVVFLAYDLLESNSEDLRPRPLAERRLLLESILEQTRLTHAATAVSPATLTGTLELPGLFDPPPPPLLPLRLSPVLTAASWEELAAFQRDSRARGVEGLMLKRFTSPYAVGRTRGDWWKWKVDPLVIDAVLVSAQAGHGRRASLYTDYTFAVWQDGVLVPVAKAYSGLTDDEILKVDAFVRNHTTGRFGPIRAVKPHLVFELAFDAVQSSTRHKAGLALRFPRMNRWRTDKKPEDADTLEALRALTKKPS